MRTRTMATSDDVAEETPKKKSKPTTIEVVNPRSHPVAVGRHTFGPGSTKVKISGLSAAEKAKIEGHSILRVG